MHTVRDNYDRHFHENNIQHWYVFRTRYGREKKAYDYIVNKGIKAFLPKLTTVMVVDGKRKLIEDSLLSNLFSLMGQKI